MPLAFLILAHKNAAQVARLFDILHRPEDLVVLHFDRRADASLHELGRTLARRHGNVHLLRPRAILWGGYRMAAVQIEAMRVALAANAGWSHFINLTGQDFPLQPVAQIDAQLARQPEASYLAWFDPVFTPVWKNARERLTRYYLEWPWLERLLRVRGVGRRLRTALRWQNRLPHVPWYRREWPDFRYYGGSNHAILSRAACTHLVGAPEAARIIGWLKHSAHANEIVFQTVLLNSPLASTVINSDRREIDFPPDSPHPRTLTVKDFDRLTASSNFFARKFDANIDAEILDRLQRRLAARPADGVEAAHR